MGTDFLKFNQANPDRRADQSCSCFFLACYVVLLGLGALALVQVPHMGLPSHHQQHLERFPPQKNVPPQGNPCAGQAGAVLFSILPVCGTIELWMDRLLIYY